MKHALSICGAILTLTLAVGCEGGDAGKAKCLEFVDLWNACVDAADARDPELDCPDDTFEAARAAGCSWENLFQSCVETFECNENVTPPSAEEDCQGTCD